MNKNQAKIEVALLNLERARAGIDAKSAAIARASAAARSRSEAR
jgi:hypothetical protein